MTTLVQVLASAAVGLLAFTAYGSLPAALIFGVATAAMFSYLVRL